MSNASRHRQSTARQLAGGERVAESSDIVSFECTHTALLCCGKRDVMEFQLLQCWCEYLTLISISLSVLILGGTAGSEGEDGCQVGHGTMAQFDALQIWELSQDVRPESERKWGVEDMKSPNI